MELTPDAIVFWEHGWLKLNATIVFTWVVMLVIALASWLVSRNLTSSVDLSTGQNLLEVIVTGIQSQIHEITRDEPRKLLAFAGTLFLFIGVCNLLLIVPGFRPPTGSLSTTVALALSVFIAVPAFGVIEQGLRDYLRHYISPTPLMLPFHIIGEFSRTLALAIRLFGNVMSGSMVVGILVALAPLFFPIVMNLLGLLTGMVQAYIFAVLAVVYIASGTRAQQEHAHANGVQVREGENK